MIEEVPTAEDIAARFKRGDEIRWTGSTSKRRVGHKGVGTFEGTLSGKVLVKYMVDARFGQEKVVPIRPSQVLLDDPQTFTAPDGG